MADYAYIMGVLRSLEAKLLNTNDLERMIDAPNAEAAFRVFNDTEYADNILDVEVAEFKKALDADLLQTKEMYEKMLGNKDLLDFLFCRHDFHNVKLSFKAKYSGKELKEFESELGNISADKIRQSVVEDSTPDLPDSLKEVVEKAKVKFEKNHDPHYIDNLLDKEMFKHLVSLVKKIDNEFVTDFLKLQIDLANIKILLRVKRLKRDISFLKNELIEGGSIPTKELVEQLDKDTKTILKYLEKYFDNKMVVIFDEYEKEDSLWNLEQGFENYELDYLQQTKMYNYGPEIVLSYFYAKKNAIRNVRLVMTGKINGVDSQEIKQRLRNLW